MWNIEVCKIWSKISVPLGSASSAFGVKMQRCHHHQSCDAYQPIKSMQSDTLTLETWLSMSQNYDAERMDNTVWSKRKWMTHKLFFVVVVFFFQPESIRQCTVKFGQMCWNAKQWWGQRKQTEKSWSKLTIPKVVRCHFRINTRFHSFFYRYSIRPVLLYFFWCCDRF